MQTLHGYNLDETQWRVGKGSQYNYATKDGKEYFIKRLTFPRYPVSDNFKGEFKQNKIDLCNEWLRHRQEIMDAIPGSGTGTIAKPIEIFREGPCYYEVSYMIDTTSMPFEELYKESVDDKRRIMLTVAMLTWLRRWTKGYTIKQPNMDCQPTEITALMRHRAVFS